MADPWPEGYEGSLRDLVRGGAYLSPIQCACLFDAIDAARAEADRLLEIGTNVDRHTPAQRLAELEEFIRDDGRELEEAIALREQDAAGLAPELAALRALADAVGEADIRDQDSMERVGIAFAAVRAAQGKP